MIITEDIKLELKIPVTNEQVEKALIERGINFIRWAITAASGNNFTIRTSHIID